MMDYATSSWLNLIVLAWIIGIDDGILLVAKEPALPMHETTIKSGDGPLHAAVELHTHA